MSQLSTDSCFCEQRVMYEDTQGTAVADYLVVKINLSALEQCWMCELADIAEEIGTVIHREIKR